MHVLNSNADEKRKKNLLEVAKQLMAAIESGEIQGFACVGIGEDVVRVFGGVSGISAYEMLGALTDYQQNFLSLHAGGGGVVDVQ